MQVYIIVKSIAQNPFILLCNIRLQIDKIQLMRSTGMIRYMQKIKIVPVTFSEKKPFKKYNKISKTGCAILIIIAHFASLSAFVIIT
jgi:hypothetical protein